MNKNKKQKKLEMWTYVVQVVNRDGRGLKEEEWTEVTWIVFVASEMVVLNFSSALTVVLSKRKGIWPVKTCAANPDHLLLGDAT